MIDPRLQTLRVLCQQGTVTATAEILHLTPSTVSQQLRQLARDLDLELLEADGRRVRLTAAARALLAHADRLSADWERACADLDAYRNADAGHLRVCGVSSAIAALIAPTAARLTAAYDTLTVEVIEEDSDESFPRLLADRADIAVLIPTGNCPTVDDPRFEQHPLLDDRQDLLVPAGHLLARRASVALAEVAEEPWIRCGYADQQRLVDTACQAAGFVPKTEHCAWEWLAISGLVAEGLGVCLIPRIAPLPPAHRVVRVPLSEPVPTRRMVTCVRRGSAERPPIARGLEVLRSVARELCPVPDTQDGMP